MKTTEAIHPESQPRRGRTSRSFTRGLLTPLAILVLLLAASATSFAGRGGNCPDADGDGFTDSACGGTDCDDTDPLINPGAAELPCDGIDNDCDINTFDDQDVDADGSSLCGPDGIAGTGDEDCDDIDPHAFPGNVEIPDGRDNDCNGLIDDGLCIDNDGDGFGQDGGPGCLFQGIDCDDADHETNPFAQEIPDGRDNDCNGLIDDGLCIDNDGDGFGQDGGPGCLFQGIDCDDADHETNPFAQEIPDGRDNDCNGLIDDGLCIDNDGDGFGQDGGPGCLFQGIDCDDADHETNPFAQEIPDGRDNDCNGLIDDGLCIDNDGDGFGQDGGPGCLFQGIDCDDADHETNPFAQEIPDGRDNDCNGLIDDGLCIDNDGDGFGQDGGPGCLFQGIDCDDADANTFPGAHEIPDGLDNNCNGQIDEGLCQDADGDGFDDLACGGIDCDDADARIFPGAVELCDGIDNDCDGAVPDDEIDNDGDGFQVCGGDCDDADNLTFPEAKELCDGLDNDCDGIATDEEDLDSDAFRGCDGDCDDADATVFPGAPEVCDGIDNDCDGAVPDDEIDNDGDGFQVCGGDCDDADNLTFPEAKELCDGLDNDCDGIATDEEDLDSDAFRGCDGDCDDTDARIFPGAAEVCDSIDNDCDGTVDDGLDIDADGDGFLSTDSCNGGDDCDDHDSNVNPDALEAGDFIDNDCDGIVDEGFDTDGDGLDGTLEHAFGLDATGADNQQLEVTDGETFTPGLPDLDVRSIPTGVDFMVRYVCRTDGSVTYTVQFSQNLFEWEDGRAAPEDVSSDGGDYKVVEVPYPFVLSNGRKARFYRIRVSLN